MDVLEVLRERNLPHVVTLIDNSVFEELDYSRNINVYELGQGLAELNKNGICLLDIKAGVSRDGITKIADVSNARATPPLEIPEDLILPEGTGYVKFKSDSWALGEFIVKYKTGGKVIPKRFLKTQSLLDKFSGEDEILRKLLVLDPEQRAYTWEVFRVSERENNACSLM